MGVFDLETDMIICQKMEALYWEACNNYNYMMHDTYLYITIALIAFILGVFLCFLCAYFLKGKRNDK